MAVAFPGNQGKENLIHDVRGDPWPVVANRDTDNQRMDVLSDGEPVQDARR